MPRTQAAEPELNGKRKPVGSKVSADNFNRLRWLAYTHSTTVSAIVSAYIDKCIRKEDFTGYVPPD